MVFRCCVKGCRVPAKNGLHGFPANKTQAEKWIMAIKSPELMDLLNANNLKRSHQLVCNNHFVESDFQSDVFDGKSRLKPNSIPSMLLPDGPDATVNIRVVNSSKQLKPPKRLQQQNSKLSSIAASKQIKNGRLIENHNIVEMVKEVEMATDFPNSNNSSLECLQQNCQAQNVASCRRCKNIIHLPFYGINKTVGDIFATKNIVILCDDCLENIDTDINCNTKSLPKNIELSGRRSKITGQSNITRKMRYLKMKVKQLQTKAKSNKINDALVINYLSNKFNKQQLEFVKMQVKNSGRSKHGRRYTSEQKSLCLAIYKQGPKSYRFKEKFFVLPTKKTLGRHSARLLFKSGVDSKVMDAVKNIVKDWPETDRYCTLSWDEVSLKEHLDYCHSRDVIEGFVELHESRRPVFATHALTFMIRGIKISFKQAMGYFYTNGLKAFELAELVKIMIGAVSATGLIILLSVCDQVVTNASTVNKLINPARPSTTQGGQLLVYTINGRKIIHCFDTSHLIKTARNNLETKDLAHHISERWNNENADDQRDVGSLQIASWEHLSTLYEMDSQSSVRRLLKLTDEHIKPNKLKMKVSLATQVFSNTCGTVMNRCIEENKIPEHFADTAKLLLFMNDVFDSMNGSKNLQEGTLKSAVTPNSIHFSFWEYALLMLTNMDFVDKLTGNINNRSSFLKKIESTIRGYVEFANTCFKLNIFSISIRDTSQDGLENFFGCVKTCNQQCKATPQQYRTGYATMTVNNITGTNSLHSNCEQDTSKAILTNIHEFILDCETHLHNPQAEVRQIDNVNEMILYNSQSDHALEVVEDFEEFEDMDVDDMIIFDPESEEEELNFGSDYIAYDLDVDDIIVFDPQSGDRELNFEETESLSHASNLICQKLMKFSDCQDCKDHLNSIAEYDTDLSTETTFLRNCNTILCGLNDIIPFICSENSIKEKLIMHTNSMKLDLIGCPEHDSVMSHKMIELCVCYTITTFCCNINNFLSGKIDALPMNHNHMQKLAHVHREKKKRIGKYTDIFNEQK